MRETNDFTDELEGCAGDVGKIGCGLIALPILIIIIFLLFAILRG